MRNQEKISLSEFNTDNYQPSLSPVTTWLIFRFSRANAIL